MPKNMDLFSKSRIFGRATCRAGFRIAIVPRRRGGRKMSRIVFISNEDSALQDDSLLTSSHIHVINVKHVKDTFRNYPTAIYMQTRRTFR